MKHFYFLLAIICFITGFQAYEATASKTYTTKQIMDKNYMNSQMKDMLRNSTMSIISQWHQRQPNWHYNNYYTMDSAKALIKKIEGIINEEKVFEKAYPCMIKNQKSSAGRQTVPISDCIIHILQKEMDKHESELDNILVKDTEREKADKEKGKTIKK